LHYSQALDILMAFAAGINSIEFIQPPMMLAAELDISEDEEQERDMVFQTRQPVLKDRSRA